MTSPLAPPAPGGIAVCNLNQAKRRKRDYGAVLTLEDPGAKPGLQLRFTAKPCPPHLVLRFEDADSTHYGYRTATADQVAEGLAFGRAAAGTSLLIHCMHGIGRSAGMALAILADRLGPGNEARAVAELIAIRPEAMPNLVVAALADGLLGRSGALTAALAAHEATDPRFAARRLARHEFALANPELYSKA